MWFRRNSQNGPSRDEKQAALDRAEQSEAALRQGRLPPYVMERIQRQRQQDLPWTSDLSVNEWALLRRYGFSPLGQVMGSSYYRFSYQIYSQSGYRYFGGGSYFITEQENAIFDGWQSAISRMREEARLLGANAVVGVRGSAEPGGESGDVEFTVSGTAVCINGLSLPQQPVLCTVSGQDFVKLVSTGILPIGLVIGVGVFYQQSSRGDMWQSQGWYNREVPAFTDAVYQARHRATGHIGRQLRDLDATGFLAEGKEYHVEEVEVEYAENDSRVNHVVEFTLFGTAIAGKPQPSNDVKVNAVLDLSRRKNQSSF